MIPKKRFSEIIKYIKDHSNYLFLSDFFRLIMTRILRMTSNDIKKSLKILFLIIFEISVIQSTTISKCSTSQVREVLIETSSGILSGNCEFINLKSYQGKEDRSSNVYSWLSVPYAEPPIGKNRFKAPIEFSSRKMIIDATKWPNSCLHSTKIKNEPAVQNFSGYRMWQPRGSTKNSEDCLYLNIFVPSDAYNQNSTPRHKDNELINFPILVFFHDSIFKNGSSALDIYNPSAFVAATKVIVITVNYRSGVFGFLHLENHFPGNQGLLDQNLALKWIKKNSQKFGGDPNRITVLGQGGGASLTGYHLFYKKSWDLFQNMILLSGTPLIESLSPISKQTANKKANSLISSLGCLNENIETLSCIQNIEGNKFLEETSDFIPFLSSSSFFGPVVDEIVLSETPVNSLKKGDFKKCPLITGFTTDEGSFFTGLSGLINSIVDQQLISHVQLSSYLDENLASGKDTKGFVLNAILHEYTKMAKEINEDGILNPLSKPSYFGALNKIIGDYIFKCPAYKFIDLIAKNNDQVYLYLFAHRISSTPWPSWYGATHGDDLAFLFSYPLASSNNFLSINENPWAKNHHRYSANEKKLNEELLEYWSSFIYKNNPNMINSNKIWPNYNLLSYDSDTGNMTIPSEAGRYIIFRSGGSKIGRGYSLESCQFWNSYLPGLLIETGE